MPSTPNRVKTFARSNRYTRKNPAKNRDISFALANKLYADEIHVHGPDLICEIETPRVFVGSHYKTCKKTFEVTETKTCYHDKLGISSTDPTCNYIPDDRYVYDEYSNTHHLIKWRRGAYKYSHEVEYGYDHADEPCICDEPQVSTNLRKHYKDRALRCGYDELPFAVERNVIARCKCGWCRKHADRVVEKRKTKQLIKEQLN